GIKYLMKKYFFKNSRNRRAARLGKGQVTTGTVVTLTHSVSSCVRVGRGEDSSLPAAGIGDRQTWEHPENPLRQAGNIKKRVKRFPRDFAEDWRMRSILLPGIHPLQTAPILFEDSRRFWPC